MNFDISAVLSVWLYVGAYAASNAGPFDIIFTSVGCCSKALQGEGLVGCEMKLQRMSRKKLVLSANLTFTVPFNDKLSISVNVAKPTNQGWKDNFFIMDVPDACSSLMKYIPKLMKGMARLNNMDHFACPVKAGNYSFTAPLSIDPKDLIPVCPYGKFRGRVYLVHENKHIFCSEGIVDIVPKKNG